MDQAMTQADNPLIDAARGRDTAQQPEALPNQPGLNIDLARMREAALHAQVHGTVFKASGSQVRQVLDYLHDRTLEIKRLNARMQELQAWQDEVRANSPLLARLERAEAWVQEQAAQLARKMPTKQELADYLMQQDAVIVARSTYEGMLAATGHPAPAAHAKTQELQSKGMEHLPKSEEQP